MRSERYFLVLCSLFTFQLNGCLNKEQRYNPSSDFLFHENGGVTFDSKRDYVAQFPALKPSSQSAQSAISPVNSVPTPKPSSGKRDYMAPQRPTNSQTPNSQTSTSLKPNSNAFTTNTRTTAPPNSPPKRDYVAPQFPTLRPVGSTPLPLSSSINSQHGTGNSNAFTTNTRTTALPNSPPKRDYVAPQFPTLRPVGSTPAPLSPPINSQHGTGNVKDLINFYDNKGQNGPNASKKPSFSSILQGQGNQQTFLPTQSPPKSPGSPTKPLSFSAALSGSNYGGNSPTANPKVTPGPNKPMVTSGGTASTKLPSNPVLPSSILNNNKNQGSKNSGPTDKELQTLSEELLKKDTNNAAKYISLNYQEKTTSMSNDDKAPQPLLTVSQEVWNIPTVQVFVPLLDNYERDTLVNEHVTSQERNEENAFMDAIMATSVMRHLMSFLKEKGYVTPDPKQQREFVKQMWFGLYSRGKGKISSSGFEHVFLSELNRGEVSGLHNWIYFSKEETANRVNYLGYLKYLPLNDKGTVIKFHYNQQGINKPVGSMFIGTSPELEMALYTLCYVTRVDTDCNLKLGSKDVNIVTYNYRYRSKNYIGSAYPQI